MCNSKNRYFYHILVSPGDAPGAVTLNVVWMEREFDAYKLSRWMCPSNYNRFWDRAIYWSKIVIFSYPFAFDAPIRGVHRSRRNITTPFAMEKLEWCGYQTVKNFEDIFIRVQRTNVTDARTDGHRVTAIAALCTASHGKKWPIWMKI